jgi:hypothetical protein
MNSVQISAFFLHKLILYLCMLSVARNMPVEVPGHWDVTHSCWANIAQHFDGLYCRHLQGQDEDAGCHSEQWRLFAL